MLAAMLATLGVVSTTPESSSYNHFPLNKTSAAPKQKKNKKTQKKQQQKQNKKKKNIDKPSLSPSP